MEELTNGAQHICKPTTVTFNVRIQGRLLISIFIIQKQIVISLKGANECNDEPIQPLPFQ